MTVFFNSWDSVIRVLTTVLIAYPGLILLMKFSGKRSLAQLNMFDFLITVALGSTFASTVILEGVTIIDGLITFAVLLSAQFLISWTASRWSFFDRLIKSKPTMLFYEGEFIEKEMKAARVTKQEVLAEVRQRGLACLDGVHAVVLETNGLMSVLAADDDINRPTLEDVANYNK